MSGEGALVAQRPGGGVGVVVNDSSAAGSGAERAARGCGWVSQVQGKAC